MNETVKAILDRRSIRAYKDEPVSEQALDILRQCALASPTARNLQSWHFSFVTDRSVIDEVDAATMEALAANGNAAMAERMRQRGGAIFYKAPLVVFVSGDNDNRWSDIDAGIAAENLAVAAHAMGLGSVIIGLCAAAFGGDEGERLGALLRFPKGHSFRIAVAIGHPAAGKEAHPVLDGRVCDI